MEDNMKTIIITVAIIVLFISTNSIAQQQYNTLPRIQVGTPQYHQHQQYQQYQQRYRPQPVIVNTLPTIVVGSGYNNYSYDNNTTVAVSAITAGASVLSALINGVTAVNLAQTVATGNRPVQMVQAAPAPNTEQSEGPPGQWVQTDGQWINGQWAPAHKVWVPVNP